MTKRSEITCSTFSYWQEAACYYNVRHDDVISFFSEALTFRTDWLVVVFSEISKDVLDLKYFMIVTNQTKPDLCLISVD